MGKHLFGSAEAAGHLPFLVPRTFRLFGACSGPTLLCALGFVWSARG